MYPYMFRLVICRSTGLCQLAKWRPLCSSRSLPKAEGKEISRLQAACLRACWDSHKHAQQPRKLASYVILVWRSA